MGTPKKILSIAGSDSGGGAGIQADLKTISALGCYGMTAITALTAQNTQGVRGIHAPPPEFLAQQIAAVFEDIGVDAVKIGMLHSPEIVRVVADALQQYQPAFVVLDPVMVATSGDALITPQTKEAIVQALFPLATVITPNLDELSLLVGRSITRPQEFESAAHAVLAMGARSVLIKGGHLDQPNLVDVLYEPNLGSTRASSSQVGSNHSPQSAERALTSFTITEIIRPKIHTKNLHGTGCTLSSAIACFLARGYPLKNAVKGAQDYVYQAIKAGAELQIGHGHGPVNHFFAPQAMVAHEAAQT